MPRKPRAEHERVHPQTRSGAIAQAPWFGEAGEAIAAKYGTDLDVVLSESREPVAVDVRHVLAYVLHQAGLTFAATGLLLHRDHSTIASAVRRVEADTYMRDHMAQPFVDRYARTKVVA